MGFGCPSVIEEKGTCNVRCTYQDKYQDSEEEERAEEFQEILACPRKNGYGRDQDQDKDQDQWKCHDTKEPEKPKKRNPKKRTG